MGLGFLEVKTFLFGLQEESVRKLSIMTLNGSTIHTPFESWNIKFGKTNDKILPGEKRIVKTHTVGVDATTEPILKYKNVRSLSKAQRVMAPILAIKEQRSFKGGHVSNIINRIIKFYPRLRPMLTYKQPVRVAKLSTTRKVF